jgi:hypothetical protein
MDKRRGNRPRRVGAGTGRRPVLTGLFGVRPETINKRIRDIRSLLDRAERTIQPAERRQALTCCH